MRHTANDDAEHESRYEGEEHEVDEAFQSVVTQSRHGLDIILQKEKTALFILAGEARSALQTQRRNFPHNNEVVKASGFQVWILNTPADLSFKLDQIDELRVGKGEGRWCNDR